MAEVAAYATAEEFREAAYQATTGALDASHLDRLLRRASRLVDDAVEVAHGYFLPASLTATETTVYGDGTDYLKLPPYVAGSITDVELPDSFTAPDYVEQGGYLVRTYDADGTLSSSDFTSSFYGRSGWPDGVRVTITARWGFEFVPADVVHATIEVAIMLWRGVDPAFAKTTDVEVSPDILASASKLVTERWRGKTKVAFA